MKKSLFFLLFSNFSLFSMEQSDEPRTAEIESAADKQWCAKIVIDPKFAPETIFNPRALVTFAGKAVYENHYERNQSSSLDVLRSLPDAAAVHVANNKNRNGDTLLHIYSGLGRTEEVKYLLGIGVDTEVKNNDDENPLEVASKQKRLDVFKLIFLAGRKEEDSLKIVKVLEGAKLLFKMPDKEVLAFYNEHMEPEIIDRIPHLFYKLFNSAIQGGNIKALKYLLKKGNIGGFCGNNYPLHTTAADGLERHLALLIKKKIFPIDELDHKNMTPAGYAAKQGHISCLALLLSHGAHLDDYDMPSPPFAVAAEAGQLEVVKYLLQHGANVNLKDDDGYTPIDHAISGGHLSMVRLFLEDYKADFDGSLYLEPSLRGHKFDIAEYFLSKGVSIDVLDEEGQTSLSRMVESNNIEGVKFALDYNADVNHPSIKFVTVAEIGGAVFSRQSTLPEIIELIENKRKSQKE